MNILWVLFDLVDILVWWWCTWMYSGDRRPREGLSCDEVN